MALNTRTRYVHLIIHDSVNPPVKLDGCRFDNLINWLKENTDFYALIRHELDTKKNNDGVLVLKPPHTHIVALMKFTLDSKGKKVYKRFSTILNELEPLTNISTLHMTISCASDWVGNCRYLLHLDSKNKYRYDLENVITSDYDVYCNFISTPSNVISVERLYNILEDCNYSLYEIMSMLGVDNYKKYRLVISDIIKSKFKSLEA